MLYNFVPLHKQEGTAYLQKQTASKHILKYDVHFLTSFDYSPLVVAVGAKLTPTEICAVFIYSSMTDL